MVDSIKGLDFSKVFGPVSQDPHTGAVDVQAGCADSELD